MRVVYTVGKGGRVLASCHGIWRATFVITWSDLGLVYYFPNIRGISFSDINFNRGGINSTSGAVSMSLKSFRAWRLSVQACNA